MAATSILELLTHPNPSSKHEQPSNEKTSDKKSSRKSNTRSLKYHAPRQVTRWEEFEDFGVLEACFSGRLMAAARRQGLTLSAYPEIDPDIDCVISDEDSARDLIHNWTRKIVSGALNSIKHEFKHVVWRRGRPPHDVKCNRPESDDSGRRNRPTRKCAEKAKGTSKESLERLRPDSGSVSRESLADPAVPRVEMFPKEYKPATKWRSEWMLESEIITDSGEWIMDNTWDDQALPVRQAFTYCIQNMCRYGCIITDREAFIFRVRPLDEGSEQDPADAEPLEDRLARNGLMEYVSVPWTNNCSREDLETHNMWTVNLALWFMHILAGEHHQVGWKYCSLEEETSARLELPTLPQSGINHQEGERVVVFDLQDADPGTPSDTNESEQVEPLYTLTPKRKRDAYADSEGEEEEEEDSIHMSFSKRPHLSV